MPDLPSTHLEQGTTLSLLWEAVDDLRQTATELQSTADAHAMTTFQFLRELAQGDTPDPSVLLRSRGQLEALMAQLCARADLEGAYLGELPVVLRPPDGSDPLEVRALESFRERYGRRASAT